MAKNKRGTNRLKPVIVTGLLLMVMGFWAGCNVSTNEPETSPPIPLKLNSIKLKGSVAPPVFTPTAAISMEPEPATTPAKDKTGPDVMPVVRDLPVEKEKPAEVVKKPAGTADGLSAPGTYTIQVGAYLIEENLVNIREKIVSLGFSPYVADIKRRMKMSCVITGEGMAEEEARELLTFLSGKGYDARILPSTGNTVDVAAGIYYYRSDALKAEETIKALGYSARVEERTVEVTLRCLRIGAYAKADETAKDLAVLERNGFSPVILKSD